MIKLFYTWSEVNTMAAECEFLVVCVWVWFQLCDIILSVFFSFAIISHLVAFNFIVFASKNMNFIVFAYKKYAVLSIAFDSWLHVQLCVEGVFCSVLNDIVLFYHF